MPSLRRWDYKLPGGVLTLLMAFLAAALSGPRDPARAGAAQTEVPKAESEKAGEEEPGNDGDARGTKAIMAEMRRIAAGLKVTTGPDQALEAELIPDALFRSQDPARELSPDGSLWGFGKKGRPAALLSLSLKPARPDRPRGWMHELNSLATVPVAAKIPAVGEWATRAPGLEFIEFPDVPPAAAKEAGRARQLRELSARFTGFESLSKGPNTSAERFELRLIPRPIHRYSDLERGQIDGALFLMTYSTNPEIVIVIELVREGEKEVWKYALTRIAFAELHVHLDGKEVWRQAHLRGTVSDEPYWLFFKTAENGQADPD